MDEDGHQEVVLADWKAARARIHDTQLDRYLQSIRDKQVCLESAILLNLTVLKRFVRMQLSMRQYYTSVIERVIPGCTWEEFRRGYALVSSRAFWVDAFHGLALVPVADAFNHSEKNHVHLEVRRSLSKTYATD
jgi:hypothetical protein